MGDIYRGMTFADKHLYICGLNKCTYIQARDLGLCILLIQFGLDLPFFQYFGWFHVILYVAIGSTFFCIYFIQNNTV